MIFSDAAALNFGFDNFRFPFRFNPGTNGENVEMGLIDKSYLVTLNQRVPGSSPGAPTIFINNIKCLRQSPRRIRAVKKVINSYKLFWCEFCRAEPQKIIRSSPTQRSIWSIRRASGTATPLTL
jgi:hypothetical protein